MRGADEERYEDCPRKLIEAEVGAALARFRASHFRERLEQRIQRSGAPASRPSPPRAVPLPVWVSLALLVLLGGALLRHRFLRSPAPGPGLTIEHFLRQLPAMQAIENRPRALPGPRTLQPSLLEKHVAGALSAAAHSAKPSPTQEHHPPLTPVRRQAKPLELRELYDILIVNRSVERVLTSYSGKTKEG